MLDGLDAPMRRYFLHALAPGAVGGAATRLSMTGRVEVGIWLPFRAVYTPRSGSGGPAAEAVGGPPGRRGGERRWPCGDRPAPYTRPRRGGSGRRRRGWGGGGAPRPPER